MTADIFDFTKYKTTNHKNDTEGPVSHLIKMMGVLKNEIKIEESKIESRKEEKDTSPVTTDIDSPEVQEQKAFDDINLEESIESTSDTDNYLSKSNRTSNSQIQDTVNATSNTLVEEVKSSIKRLFKRFTFDAVAASFLIITAIGIIGATTSIINPEPSGIFASKTQLGPSEPMELIVPEIEPTIVEFPISAEHNIDTNVYLYTSGRTRINYLKSMSVADLY